MSELDALIAAVQAYDAVSPDTSPPYWPALRAGIVNAAVAYVHACARRSPDENALGPPPAPESASAARARLRAAVKDESLPDVDHFPGPSPAPDFTLPQRWTFRIREIHRVDGGMGTDLVEERHPDGHWVEFAFYDALHAAYVESRRLHHVTSEKFYRCSERAANAVDQLEESQARVSALEAQIAHIQQTISDARRRYVLPTMERYEYGKHARQVSEIIDGICRQLDAILQPPPAEEM